MSQQRPSLVPQWFSSMADLSWRLLVVAAAVVLIGLAFRRLELVLVPIIGALFLSTILVPPARVLRRHRWPPLLATWAVFLGAVVLIGGVAALVVPSAVHQSSRLGNELNDAIHHAETWLTRGPFHISRADITRTEDQIRHSITTNQSRLVHGALTGVTVLAETLGGALLTLVLTFFFVKDGPAIGAWALELVDERRASDFREVGVRAWTVLSGYVRGTAINGLVNATVIGVGLWILGVPLVLPLALLMFVGGFLPLVGSLLSGGAAALVALAAKGPIDMLIVIGLSIVIHHLEGYLVGPLVLGRAVRLHPIAVLLALTAGTILGGVIGAFMAVPLLSVGLAVNGYYREQHRRQRLGLASERGVLLVSERPERPERAERPMARSAEDVNGGSAEQPHPPAPEQAAPQQAGPREPSPVEPSAQEPTPGEPSPREPSPREPSRRR
jgi:predicted PurR-regulated permease PerM